MTTPWKPSGEWKGATVAVMGAGPSLTAQAVESLRMQADRIIVVNDVCLAVQDADMLVALDGNWPQAYRDFAGIRIAGVADADLDAFYAGPRWECVTLRPGHRIEVRNSGLTAVRIAAEMGAARILLAGFDPDLAPAKSDLVPQVGDGPYTWLAEGLAALERELSAAGVDVQRWAPPAWTEEEGDES